MHNLVEGKSCLVTNLVTLGAGPVAQWLEQGTHNPLVVGSSPTGPTIYLSPIAHSFRAFILYE